MAYHENPNNHLIRERGFTLTEILIAVVVLSLGLTGSYALFMVSSRTTAINDAEITAGLIADYYLKKTMNYSQKIVTRTETFPAHRI